MQVLDVGCGEGRLLSALCNPAPWLDKPTSQPYPYDSVPRLQEQAAKPEIQNIHLFQLHGLDVSIADLESAAKWMQPQLKMPKAAYSASPWDVNYLDWPSARWDDLDVSIWKGGVEHVNPTFIGIDCIVSTEVFVIITG